MKIFTTVYRCGSVTRAAQELHLAQPSLSVAIRELEEHYGVRLFERTGRAISPTQAAGALYGYASHIVSLFDDMEKQMRNWDTLGVLRLGASVTIGTHILPDLIRRYQARVPQLRIEALVEQSSGIERKLLDNEIDIGLIETQPEQPELLAIPFCATSCARLCRSALHWRKRLPSRCASFPSAPFSCASREAPCARF
ncbi:MAG: LysR family transcriptional regulator [Oscillospiraceae bacterium]